MRKLTPPLIEMILKRLERSWDREWDPDHRDEFARALSTMDGDLDTARAALDEVVMVDGEWRPTIARFAAALTRARQASVGVHQPVAEPRTVTNIDREAAAFFIPRLKDIISGIGSGPQPGSQAACDAVVEEWYETHPKQRGRLS